MGLTVSKSARDAAASVSPWTTQVRVHNLLNMPVWVWLCRDAEAPSAEDAIMHAVPACTESGIISGWLREPRATLLIRTGIDVAKVIRMPHATRLVMTHAPHGLTVESTDEDVVFEDFADPGAVPGNDTVPMRIRGESFADRAPKLQATQESAARDTGAVPKRDADEVGLDSQLKAPLLEALCQDADASSAIEAVQNEVPAESAHGISSGGLAEPSATPLIGTGMDEAEVMLTLHATCPVRKAAPLAPELESIADGAMPEDLANLGAGPGHGTMPKQVREEAPADHVLALGGA